MSKAGALLQLEDVVGKPVLEDSADVVIVGTGAAGAVAARVLTEAGADVVLIEEGPSVPVSELRADVYTGASRVWRDMGGQVAEGRSFIPLLQGRCVGGSTAINSAIIHRLPEKILSVWHEEHGAGDVLRREALERAWDRLDEELYVSPSLDPVLGENSRLMLEGARARGITANVMRRNVSDCQGSARCLQGCPTSRKQSMNVSYVPRSIAAGARVYATCRAVRVAERGGRAAGVIGQFADPRTGERGPRLVVHARHAVVVAASAIQTPGLLARSGLGRRSGLVGRRFQAHPGTAVLGVFDRPVRMDFGATQGVESTQFWDQRMKLETLALPPELGAVRLPSLGSELLRDLEGYGNLALWAVQIRARAHGRVHRSLFGRTVISYDPTDEDVRTLKQGVKVLCEMMFAAGAREILPGVHGLPDRIASMDPVKKIDELPDDPRLFHCIASHLFGTATLGANPSTSVVGPDGQSHELPGLFVLDSSVFPTNIGVNPQHSIAGIAWVYAERIAASIRPVTSRGGEGPG